MRTTLAMLREQGYVLGIATGRPGQEAIQPLKNYGLYDYFDARRIVTHDEVAQAEAELRARGDVTPLVKPHPYIFLRAADPGYHPGQPLPPRGSFLVVGDSTSDVLGARAANALVVAVLTGMRTPEARALLEESRPDFLIADMTGVPALLARIDDLATIQRMQFTERAKAELLLQRWFQRHMHLPTESITLLPKPVSLNSFNGIYRADSQEYFFKTHIEEQGILQEYYHAELLANAGYNIVRPLRTLHERGQQMVVYPLVRWPVMFDLMRAAETGDTTHTDASQARLAVLAAAEKHECERLLDIYASTLAESTASEHAQAPIHQLFWHRLTGARYKTFYEGKAVLLPHQDEKSSITFEDLLTYHWVVNRISLPVTLGELVEQAKQVLNPARAMYTVIGHGDAHFGNVFLEAGKQYLYFDPAFAGRHSPLLDVVKPFFHNVFATWMYFPQDIARDLHLTVALRRQTVYIEHDYELSPVRQAILTMKRRHLLPPLIAHLRERR
ncbi:MAG: HAD family hydrolase, partial [Ktedonobacteraceae bacterium]|nr:HAD family hydrolase [Ktedonobacteraceae bacterium]